MADTRNNQPRPKRFSLTTSRLTFKNTYDINIDSLSESKALYDRQLKTTPSCSDDVTHGKPIPLKYSRERSGCDLGVIFQSEDTSKVTTPSIDRRTKSWHFSLLNYIDSKAVSHGLQIKNQGYVSRSESPLLSQSSCMDIEENLKVIFEGGIKTVERPCIDTMNYFQRPSISDSVHVNQSEVKATKSGDVWMWPWIDPAYKSLSLYKAGTKCPNLFSNQTNTLPKLECPLPALTFKRYLKSVEPCVSFPQFLKTKEIVKKFALNESAYLNEKILSFSSSNEGWVSQSLQNYNYCYSEEEAALLNLGIIAPFCHDVWPEKEDSLLERAVVIIYLATEFWNLIRTETLKPIQDDKGNAIDMQQFMELFSSTTVPGKHNAYKYRFMKTESEGETASGVIIAYRGILFTMNVTDKYNLPLPLADIANSLKVLMNFADTRYKDADDGVSVLTSSKRSTWAEARARLLDLGNNQAYFSEIEQSMFIISLDHLNVRTFDLLAGEALFADGFNRWYDKSLNFYIYRNGFVTVNINSKILDSSTVAFLLHYMHLRIWEESQMLEDDITSIVNLNLDSAEIATIAPATVNSTGKVDKPARMSLEKTDLKMLVFALDDNIRDKIYNCAKMFSALSSEVLTSACKLDNFDATLISTKGLHNDAFVHMALHLTFYRMYHRWAPIGCRISIKKFENMRYDIMRATTNQVVAWCKAYEDSNVDKATKDKLFWEAHSMHLRLLKECHCGDGCDNHLNAMRNTLKLDAIPPEINMFKDDSFFLSGGGDRYEILTESVGQGCTSCPVFLPCNPKGYGIGYSMANSFLFFTITTWVSEPGACAPLFAACLKRTCEELLSYKLGGQKTNNVFI